MTTDFSTQTGTRLGGVRSPSTVWAAVAAVALIAGAVLLVVFRPAGRPTAEAAALAAVNDPAQTASVLVTRPWGDGTLVLAGSDDLEGGRHLALAFAVDRGRGWRVAALSQERADRADVVVGSLLVADSDGGRGQPAWSAAYGELGDDRVVRVEIHWDAGEPVSADRRGDAYLVVREGRAEPRFARFLAADGSEIARVPIA